VTDPVDILGDIAARNVPLGPMTTYRVGGPAMALVEAQSLDDLERVQQAVAGSDVPILAVGRGSNLLVADAGFPGIAVVLGEAFAAVSIDDAMVTAGAAAAMPVVARRSAAAGLTGFEWAVGVPGSVGGGVRMNAGGHGAAIADVLTDATVVDLRAAGTRVLTLSELDFGYRHSAVAADQIVTSARFGLTHGDQGGAEARISEIVQWRRENQPGGQNAGSVFTNPAGDSAGRIIDAAGLRGFRVGTAHVSEKHANFFQADPGGSADDVVALIREVQRRVREAMGVELIPEVQLVGFS
jgi:UDP-N-acetylmuramate dehydrogenase